MIETKLEAEAHAVANYEAFKEATTLGQYRDLHSFKANKGPYKDCWHVVKLDVKHPWDDGTKVCTVIFDKEGQEKKIITHN